MTKIHYSIGMLISALPWIVLIEADAAAAVTAFGDPSLDYSMDFDYRGVAGGRQLITWVYPGFPVVAIRPESSV